MKKIFGLLTALLVAVASMTFTSCATDHTSDTPAGPSLTGWFVSGLFNNWGADALTASGSTYTAEITADAADSEFMVRNDGWTSKYCNGTTIPVGTATNVKAGGDNAKITGMTTGKKYIVTVVSYPAWVTVTVTLKPGE